MAILIVMAKDNPPHDRGDVVDVFPDTRTWFGKVAEDEQFLIIHSDMSEDEAGALCAAELGDPKLGPLYYRAFKLDLDALPKPISRQMTVSRDELLAVKKTKPSNSGKI